MKMPKVAKAQVRNVVQGVARYLWRAFEVAMSAWTCLGRFWEDLSPASATAVHLQDKNVSMAGHGPPSHSLVWLGRLQGREPTTRHRLGPLLVTEVAGLGLGLKRAEDPQQGTHPGHSHHAAVEDSSQRVCDPQG